MFCCLFIIRNVSCDNVYYKNSNVCIRSLILSKIRGQIYEQKLKSTYVITCITFMVILNVET